MKAPAIAPTSDPLKNESATVKPAFLRLLLRALAPAGAALVIFGLGAVTTAAAEPLRLGWQVPWATQGQVVMGLKHSTITDLLGLDLAFIGFPYGAPLNGAALAGDVDILLTADQPALVLLAHKPGFKIVARLMYNRACLYVPPDSAVTRLSQLSGGTVKGPVGAAAERVAVTMLRDAGVPPAAVQLGNLDMSQQTALLRRSVGQASWSGIDALYGFDPLPAVFEENGQARILGCGKIVSVVLASDHVLQRRRAELERFLGGLALSWWLFARHPQWANAWFAAESQIHVSEAALDRAAMIEPNRSAATFDAVRLDFTDDDRAALADAARFLFERGTLRRPVDVASSIDVGPLQDALSRPELSARAGQVSRRADAPR